MKKFVIAHKAQLSIGFILGFVLVAGLIKSINQGNTLFIIITIVAMGMLIIGFRGKINSNSY